MGQGEVAPAKNGLANPFDGMADVQQAAQQGNIRLLSDDKTELSDGKNAAAENAKPLNNNGKMQLGNPFAENGGEISKEESRYSLNEHADSAFAKAVDKAAAGHSGSRRVFVPMGRTPDVLKMLGLPDATVSMREDVFNKVLGGKHFLTPETLKRLPEQLNNPIAVTRSRTVEQGYLVFTELQENVAGVNKPVVAALHVKVKDGGIDVIDVASAYGRNATQINEDLKQTLYWNKTKGYSFADRARLQLPNVILSLRNSLSAHDIKTESDLAQYRNGETVANPQQQAAGLGEVAPAKNADNANHESRYSLNEHADSAFAKAVDTVANGGSVSGYVKVGTTPDVLKMLGLPDVRVTISGEVLNKVMRDKHNVTPETLKQLPKQINNPVAVMKSSTTANGYVVLTELTENGKPVIAALHLKRTQHGLELMSIASVYGRSRSQIQRGLANDLLYWNMAKGSQFATAFGLQLPSHMQSNANLSGRNIKTESDLAQYRNGETVANPQQQAAGLGEVASEAAAKQRAEQQKAAMRDYVNGALGDLAQYVEVVNSRDVFAGAELKAVRDGGVEGMFYRGKQYLFADMASPERAAWVAWHELGHRGFSNAEFAAHRNLLRRVGKNATIRQMADFIMAERKGNLHDAAAENYNVAVEEALVELYAAQQTGNWAEIEQRYGVQTKGMRGEIRGWLAQMAARLKQAYAKLFGREAASNDEVMGLVGKIHQANKRMAKGQGEVASAKNADNANHESRHSLNENAGSDFAQAVDAVANGGVVRSRVIHVGTTPNVLKMLGLPDADVVIHAKTLQKVMQDKHAVAPDVLKRVPAQINNPVAVMKSSTTANGYVVLTELTENGKPVIAALHLKQAANGLELINIASVYGRSRSQIQNGLNNDLLYWNKEKGAKFLNDFTLQLRSSSSETSPVGKHIKTESDLSQYQNGEKRFSRASETYADAKAQGETVLTEQQWHQVRTPEFKAWFGDWENDPENASKVINQKTGEPLVVYHGTPNGRFNIFDIELQGAGKNLGKGIYFSTDKSTAKQYATGNNAYIVDGFVKVVNPIKLQGNLSDAVANVVGGKRYLTALLKQKGYSQSANAKHISVGKMTWEASQKQYEEALRQVMLEHGYDGIVKGNIVIALEPKQIKSATDNSGAFSLNSDDIRFSVRQKLNNAAPKRTASSYDEARAIVMDLLGEPLTNRETGMVATISKRSLDKLVSGKAVNKSSNVKDHLTAVANIDNLFEDATLGWTDAHKNADPNIAGVHRLFAPLNFDGVMKLVKLTVKEMAFNQGNRIYSVETIEVDNGDLSLSWKPAPSENAQYTSQQTANVESLIEEIENFNKRNGGVEKRFSRRPKSESLAKLRDAATIRISGKEIEASSDVRQYRRNALEFGKTLRGAYVNKDTGQEIVLGVKGVKEVLQHDYKDPDHLQSIAAIPQIIEQAVYIDTLPNEEPSKNVGIREYDYYLAGLKIGGNDYVVRAAVGVSENGDRYYDHKLSNIEKGELLSYVHRITNPGPGKDNSPNQGDLLEMTSRLSSAEISNSSPAIDDKRLLQILQDDGTFDGSARFSRRKIRDVDEVRDFARTGKLQDDAGFWARLRSGELLEETRDNLLRDFADNLIDVKRKVEDWEIGGAEQANLIGAMYRASGVRDAQNELIHREYLQPLYRLLAQMTKRSKGLSVLEVKKLAGYWLTARYAPTLNKRFLAQHQQAVDDAQDAYNQDPSSKNYDALNRAQRELAARERAVRGLDKGKVAGGLSDPVAAELMANIEKLLRVGDLERVGSLVSGALSHTLKLDLESGRITQAQYDEYRLNADYVPMTGDPLADLADDVITGSSGINQGRDHQAKGRSSVADDGIDAAMGAIAKATANYGWADFKNQLNDVYENALADLRNRGLSNADALAQVKQSFGMERRARQSRGGDNVVFYRKNGMDYEFDLGKTVGEALRDANKEPTLGMLKVIATPTRWFARGVTQFNPAFAPKNLVRDLWEKSETIRTMEAYKTTRNKKRLKPSRLQAFCVL